MMEKRWGYVRVHFENTFTDLTSDFAQNVCYVNFDLTMACRQADTSAACSINQATTVRKKICPSSPSRSPLLAQFLPMAKNGIRFNEKFRLIFNGRFLNNSERIRCMGHVPMSLVLNQDN